MHLSGRWRFVLLGLMVAGPASAQIILDAPNLVIRKPQFDKTEVKARPEVWPRLDRGATLCQTEADLLRLAASRRGEPVERPNCQVVRLPTAIQIVKRVGPGRTQVTLTEQNALEGWTDAWLPEKPPPASGSATSIR